MKKKYTLLLLSIFLIGCDYGLSDSKTDSSTNISSNDSSIEASSSTQSSSESSSSVEDSSYDFGDPASWKGDSITAKDLGDCILDAFPSDEMYDWGQSIMYDDEAKVYKMWWCRQSGYDTIWYAESNDLKHWHNAQKIMCVEEDSTWLKWHVGKPTVIRVNDEYRMYFEAPATIVGYKEFDNNVLMATSTDGIHFEYYKGDSTEPQPVIRMTDYQMEKSMEYALTPASNGYGYYGIGQPSAVYVNGTYYLYCTYSLGVGDRMYVFTSNDGLHFDAGREVFTRAGCGVKYNTLTNKFVLSYESTLNSRSRVYVMESTDGINFEYKDLTTGSTNPSVVSKGSGTVHGYADFVGDRYGHINTYTTYVSYMEGKMADVGNDWRQYSNTWDIHIAMYNPKEFANRAMVLPNGQIYNSESIIPYNDKHITYDDKMIGIPKFETRPNIDGKLDDEYSQSPEMKIDRPSFSERAVPADLYGTMYMGYTDKGLYCYIKVHDLTVNDDDLLAIVFDERHLALTKEELRYIYVKRNSIKITDGTKETKISNISVSFKEQEDGYVAEMYIPWSIKTTITKYDAFGFDCYIANKNSDVNFKSLTSFNQKSAYNDNRYAAEIYFK